jgi:hypothetical protein
VLFPKPPWLCNRKNSVLVLLENFPTTVTFCPEFYIAQINEMCFWVRSEIMAFFSYSFLPLGFVNSFVKISSGCKVFR